MRFHVATATTALILLSVGCQLSNDDVYVTAEVASTEQRQVDDVLSELDHIVRKLGRRFDRATPNKGETKSPTSLAEIDTVDMLVDEIEAMHPTSGELAKARASQLQAYFLAGKIAPDKYRPQFDSFSQQLIDGSPDADTLFQARTLQLFADHDLKKSATKQLMRDIKETADSFEQPGLGVMIYAVVASQLNAAKRKKSAELVLTQGMEHFKGKPGRRKLFDQLIAQGHRKAPRAKYPGGAFGKHKKKPVKGDGNIIIIPYYEVTYEAR